jgi:MFS family permease
MDVQKWPTGQVVKRIALLSISYGLFIAVTTTLDTIGPAALSSIGAAKDVSTFTFTGYHIGAFLAAAGSSFIFKIVGRRSGFLFGAAVQVLGATAALVGIEKSSVGCLLFSSVSVGFGQGLGGFIRFCAAEIVPIGSRAKAIAYVMITGVISAILGPISGTLLVSVFPKPFMGSFAAYAFFSTTNLVVLYFSDLTPYSHSSLANNASIPENANQGKPDLKPTSVLFGDATSRISTVSFSIPKERDSKTILTGSIFIHAVIIGVLAQITMTIPMMSMSVSMIVEYGYSLQMSSLAMLCHIVSTFAVGPLTAHLLTNYGILAAVGLSNFVNVLGFVIFAVSKAKWSFICGMSLVGMAWNLGYSAGSLLLTYACYEDEKKLQVVIQAWNDSIVYILTSVATICAGILAGTYNWPGAIVFGSSMTFIQLVHIAICWYHREMFVPSVRPWVGNKTKQTSLRSSILRMSMSLFSVEMSADIEMNEITLDDSETMKAASPLH